MSLWDAYENRVGVSGTTKKDAVSFRARRVLSEKLSNSLSYNELTIYGADHGYNIDSSNFARTYCENTNHGVSRRVAVINSDNLNEKHIFSLPDEDIENGSLVSWMDNYWLVTERDANTTLYTRAKMVQCNYLLRWVSDDHRIIEQWCIVEDGTKYLTGEYEDRNFVITRGDSRIAVTMARNELTAKFDRERRFLIDDPDSKVKLAYQLTKPFKLGWTYNNQGSYKFVLQEVSSTDNDNQELAIADYYKFFPREIRASRGNGDVIDTENTSETTGKKVWL